MALFGRRSVRWMALVSGIVLLLGGVLAAVPTTAHARLLAARAQWATRPFDAYRMVIEETAVRCRQDVAVRAEVVVKRFSNSCRTVPWTVTGLFSLAEQNHSTRYRCVDRGCACDTVMTARVRYDEQLGYPTRLEFRWTIAPNVSHPDFWWQIWADRGLPQCRALSYSQTIQVVSLSPLQ